jgi:hypothetical protein
MKWLILFICLFCFLEVHTQPLQLKGRIRCSNDTNNFSTRGAENILVVPTAIPSKSVPTSSDPPGFFLINTNVQKEILYDKAIKLYIITNCKTCKKESYTKFISIDQITYENGIPQVNLKTKYIKMLCDSTEFSPQAIDTFNFDIISSGDQDIKKTGWVASPALLNVLGFIPLPAMEIPQPDTIIVDTIPMEQIPPSNISFGKLLLNSTFMNSSTAGFNFSPSRNYSEAPFWNPASINLCEKKANISVSTNWRNQLKIASFLKFNNNFGTSIGFLNSYQSERSTFESDPDKEMYMDYSESFFKLNEYAIFIGASYKILKSASIGLTCKYISQKLRIPQELERSRYFEDEILQSTKYGVIHNLYKDACFDFDLSIAYSFNNTLNIGLNLMNLTNSSLIGGSFLANEDIPKINLFSIGAGISYKYQRFNFGTDILYHDQKIYNVSFGLNYVPFNMSLIEISYSPIFRVHSLSFKYRNFKISYINNQGNLVSRKVWFGPYLYSGFVKEF